MNKLTDREKRNIQAVSTDNPQKGVFASLSENRRTAAVSLAAVSACGHNLEYVPETVINREICSAALKS
ncbi:MAG: hypothetical protein LBL57_06175, partial [Tannerella sp.]|nr:hypothetical protein [Tannerella sp.]